MSHCQLPIADCRLNREDARGASRRRARAIANRKLAIGNGFTLTEVLIVIGIIVLMLALAVPALNLLSGTKSIDGAENNLSAMLGRARADALGLQKDTGVFFFIDPGTDRVTAAEVWAVTGPTATTVDAYLDLVPDRDWLALPKGVLAQVIDDASVTGGVRADDGFVGYNPYPAASATPTLQYGGVILFDSAGRLTSKRYVFRGQKVDATGTLVPTDIYHLLQDGKISGTSTGGTDFTPPSTPGPIRSQFGLVLIDRESFMNNGDLTDVQVAGGTYATKEQGEEAWLDDNATPLVVNRYNGTLVRGE
jgi:prepilin-type N-terminal cleavage/methylation domain-containing protein